MSVMQAFRLRQEDQEFKAVWATERERPCLKIETEDRTSPHTVPQAVIHSAGFGGVFPSLTYNIVPLWSSQKPLLDTSVDQNRGSCYFPNMVTSESWVSHALERVRGCFFSTVAVEEVVLCTLNFCHRFPEGNIASSPFALQSLVLTPPGVPHD